MDENTTAFKLLKSQEEHYTKQIERLLQERAKFGNDLQKSYDEVVLTLNQRKQKQLINFNQQIDNLIKKAEAKMRKAEAAKKKLETWTEPKRTNAVSLLQYISVSVHHFQLFKQKQLKTYAVKV